MYYFSWEKKKVSLLLIKDKQNRNIHATTMEMFKPSGNLNLKHQDSEQNRAFSHP